MLRKATKVHVYARFLAFLSKPERSLTPQLDTVITKEPSVNRFMNPNLPLDGRIYTLQVGS